MSLTMLTNIPRIKLSNKKNFTIQRVGDTYIVNAH